MFDRAISDASGGSALPVLGARPALLVRLLPLLVLAALVALAVSARDRAIGRHEDELFTRVPGARPTPRG